MDDKVLVTAYDISSNIIVSLKKLTKKLSFKADALHNIIQESLKIYIYFHEYKFDTKV